MAKEKTLAERALERKTAEELIALIQGEVAGKSKYVYRGTPSAYIWDRGSNTDEKRINSSIFRKYDEKIDFGDHYQPAHIESEIIKKARSHFLPHTSNIEILSDLRHFGGDTTLIDFSSDLLVALFFACSEKLEEKGELIAFSVAEAKNPSDDYFKNNGTGEEQLPTEMSLLSPAQTQTNKARVIAQKSVFIHTPKGFIPHDSCKIIPIKNELKVLILDYLKHFHDIDERTIYPDLHGFIAAQKRFASPRMHFYAGNALFKQKQYKKATEEYDEAIKLKSDFVDAYLNRGVAKMGDNKVKEAIANYNEIIRINPDYAEAYYNRGLAKTKSNKLEEAITDYTEAIRLKPDYADAYFNRGLAKMQSNQSKEAIADFSKAIHIKPNDAIAYWAQGWAKFTDGQTEEAIADCSEALKLKPDYAEAYALRGAAWERLMEHEKAQSDLNRAKEFGFEIQNEMDDSFRSDSLWDDFKG